MTVSISAKTVVDSISHISIAGITIKNIAGIPTSGSMVTPILFPQPDGWLSDIEPTAENMGSGSSRMLNFNYTLNYVFLMSPVGSGISDMDNISPLADFLELILEAMLTNDTVTGLVDLMPNGVSQIGQVKAPDDNLYWGILFSLRCLEFAQ